MAENPRRSYESSPAYPLYPSFVSIKEGRFPLVQPMRGMVLTGDVCTGSTTLARELALRAGTAPYLVGEEIRAMCSRLGVSWTDIPREQLIKLYEDTTAKIKSEKQFIVEGRFVGAQSAGLGDVVKILCVADSEVVAARYMARKGIIDRAEGLRQLEERMRFDRESIRSTYEGITIEELLESRKFDIVVDTTNYRPDQIADQLLNLLQSR